MRNRNRSDGESGSGTLLVAGLVALALTCALILAASSVVLGERARLDAVAALSALAGADVSATALWEDVGDRSCATAGAVARENGAVMESCEVLGADTRVIVSVRRSVLGFNAPIRARARAGPLTEPAEGGRRSRIGGVNPRELSGGFYGSSRTASYRQDIK
ncbi:Rv3654c family TadE-like protein [Schaalia hyovaginalis]|uniref:Rv3654c family TadE-like protein n=1 Tax=Schaalia hyovaginalis TaxID=29316 RepID=UPI00139C7127|nr:Rv3654c family TadE-like protein [Schaalia hyovaginalis]MST63739.1 flp pilus-assembly TadE/G-like family protein [Schaalia hyovaginalis]